MPLHDFRCRVCGHEEERTVRFAELHTQLHTAADHIGFMDHFYKTAPAGFVQRDICYDSPIDGRPITSKQARIEDLKRSECVEWDPEMRKDYARRREEAETRLDKALDETVEAAIEVMDVRKKEKLEQELRAGASVEITRPDTATLH